MKKVLVSYFSAGGVTRKVATLLANGLEADLEKIVPVEPYTKEDLDWRNKNSRSTIEMNSEKARPAIEESKHKLPLYDVILVGFPIWWGIEPKVVDTYLDLYNLNGKKIIPFATSGGSEIEYCVNHLKHAYPTADITEGFLLNHGIDPKLIELVKNS